MKYIAYFFIILGVIVINFGVVTPLGLGWLAPSLLLLIIVCIVMEYGSFDFVWFALAGGIWLEQFYGLAAGSLAGAYLIIGLLAYLLFQRLILTGANWKYYLAAVFSAEVFMFFWIWAYTSVLNKLGWAAVVVSGRQLWHNAWAAILICLIFALPVYGLVVVCVRRAQQWSRRPLNLS